MCISDIGPVRALVVEVAKFLAPEALDLSEFSSLPVDIIGVCFAIVRVILFVLHKNDSAGGRR